MSILNTHFGADRIGEMLRGCKKIFFIGIGGVSMSSLALITKRRGFDVAGSDRAKSAITDRLAAGGVEVLYGHDGENVKDCDAVVYTLAIGEDNPEYVMAQKLGIPTISRADYLGYIMTGYRRRLGVSGMHGKSTCTGMCAAVFMAAESDPTVVSGASYAPMGGFYRIGNNENFIFEACEYKDSFLDFCPTDAIVLNIEHEHVDYFPDLSSVCCSFSRFAALTGEGGRIFYNADDENSAQTFENFGGKKITFGINGKCDFSARNIVTEMGMPSFDLFCGDTFLCRISLNITGMHNVYNALAAASAAYEYGIAPEAIKKGLEDFCGIGRRMEYRGALNGARVFDDYAHHPTEIEATLKGAREMTEGRLICAFQPHTYSRTKALFDGFVSALSVADEVILAPIYAAREPNDPEVSSKRLALAIGERASACDAADDLAKEVKARAKEGDTVIVMGAGDIDKVCTILEYDK